MSSAGGGSNGCFVIVLIVVVVGAFFLLSALFKSCEPDPITTYYYDSNRNGKEDWGEAVWAEDEDGNIVHVYD